MAANPHTPFKVPIEMKSPPKAPNAPGGHVVSEGYSPALPVIVGPPQFTGNAPPTPNTQAAINAQFGLNPLSLPERVGILPFPPKTPPPKGTITRGPISPNTPEGGAVEAEEAPAAANVGGRRRGKKSHTKSHKKHHGKKSHKKHHGKKQHRKTRRRVRFDRI
jgi:hypothetical protein